MTVNEALRLLAGSVVLFSLLMGLYVSQNWFFLTGFVALNLIQSAFTKWCPAMWAFQKMGLK
ncbi:MAG: DUF2892 domain-containing protein [Hahellaceae bacterium]|nr:DUF2892 domain-containing protein [Hahellaceae bacterium]MCP5169071.1 DUF2892 domain-containing protein [Hahellaceae bacterium]